MSDFVKLECKVVEKFHEGGADDLVLHLQLADKYGMFPKVGGKIIHVRVTAFNGLVNAGFCAKRVQVTGNWINQYQSRFDVYSSILFRPEDTVEMLSSLLNLTPLEATKVFNAYGHNYIDVFNNNPKELRKIKGFGGGIGDIIIERWQERRDSILFYLYCIQYDAPGQTMNAIWAKFGKDSLRVLQSSAAYGLFKLCEIPEVSYHFIERLAFDIGCTVDNEYRIAAQELPSLYDNKKRKYSFNTNIASNDVTASYGRVLIDVCRPAEMDDIRFYKLYASTHVIEEQLPVLLSPGAPKRISVYGHFSEYMKFSRPNAFPQIFTESVQIIQPGDIDTHLRYALQISPATCNILMRELGSSFPEVIKYSAERISNLPGISEEEAAVVIDKWSKYRGIYELGEKYLPLYISTEAINALNTELGPDAVSIIDDMSIDDIYNLMYIQNVDFRSADIITLDKGVERNAHVRVRALCIWASWLALWNAGKYGPDRMSFRQIHWFGMSLDYPATEAAISSTLGIMHAAGEVEYIDGEYEGSSVQLFHVTIPPWRRKPGVATVALAESGSA